MPSDANEKAVRALQRAMAPGVREFAFNRVMDYPEMGVPETYSATDFPTPRRRFIPDAAAVLEEIVNMKF